MKFLVLASIVFAFIAAPVFADDEEDSALKKAGKLAILNEADDDSLAKKAVQLDAVKDIADDEDDSTMKKAAKYKVLKEVSE
jgi:hypothetical protein